MEAAIRNLVRLVHFQLTAAKSTPIFPQTTISIAPSFSDEAALTLSEWMSVAGRIVTVYTFFVVVCLFLILWCYHLSLSSFSLWYMILYHLNICYRSIFFSNNLELPKSKINVYCLFLSDLLPGITTQGYFAIKIAISMQKTLRPS